MFKRVYHSKYFPRIFYKKPDGGQDSGVTGYFLIEWKSVFSIGLLHFKKGSREAFHSHAFNALSFWLKGSVTEEKYNNPVKLDFSKGLKPKYTPRDNIHKIVAHEDTYCLTFRGPWLDYWSEYKNNKHTLLTHGRQVINGQ